jgi:hypothetical protein
MSINLGSTVSVEWVPSWEAAGHSVSLRVTKPDGSTTSPAASDATTPGTFTAELDADMVGRYVLRWTDTDVDAVGTDIFDVWPEDPRFLISVDDAAVGLQWRAVDQAKHGDALRLYVAAATEVIEDITGAVLVRTVTQTADGGRTGVALWERPSEIVSVTVDGAASTGYVVNLNAGIVYADKSGSQFPDGIQTIVITYKVGAEAVPPSIQLAARELVRHMWQVGQQALTGDGSPTYDPVTGEMANTRTGFAVPRRVIELCSNQYSLPGIA